MAPLALHGKDIAITLVAGDDEMEYWTKLVNHAKAAVGPDVSTKLREVAISTSTTSTTSSTSKVATTGHVHFDDDDGNGGDETNEQQGRNPKRQKR